MDLFPVAVRGSRIISCGRTAGGVRVQVLEFLQHWVCTGTLYCVRIARTQGPDLIQNLQLQLRRRLRRARCGSPAGAPVPGHCQRKKRAHTHAFVLSVHLLQGDKEGEGSEEAVEGEEGEVLEGGEGADDDEYEKAPPSPSAEDHDDGDSSLADIGYLIN